MNRDNAGQGEVQPMGMGTPVAHDYAMRGNYAAQGGGCKPPLDQPWYGIGFGDATWRLFRKAFVFSGRASRGEYWWAVAFALLAALGIRLVCGVMDSSPQGQDAIWDVASDVFTAVLFIPFVSLLFRRLHDENLSGWWWLLPGVLFIGALTALGVSAMKASDVSVAAVWMLVALVLYLLHSVASVVLAVLPTKAAGARFDKSMHTVAVSRVASGAAGENTACGR